MDRVVLPLRPGRRIIVDSGTVIAWARGDYRIRAIILQAESLALPLIVPIVVIPQVIRGGPTDAPINRFLKLASEISPVTPLLARQAGVLLVAPERPMLSTPSSSPRRSAKLQQ